MKIFRSLVILFLIGLFLTTGIIPGFSHNIIRNNNNSVAFNQAQQQSKLTEARNLVRQGREYYQVEKYQEAIAKLEQAADIFAQLGESSSEAITRSNLSLAYQQLSQWKEAENLNITIPINPRNGTFRFTYNDTKNEVV